MTLGNVGTLSGSVAVTPSPNRTGRAPSGPVAASLLTAPMVTGDGEALWALAYARLPLELREALCGSSVHVSRAAFAVRISFDRAGRDSARLLELFLGTVRAALSGTGAPYTVTVETR